ncbi:type 4a pilus biogenesis protein PilO [Thermoanaerobacterium sp. R66]|uniref:type 4a pilus biogenesis protein PilO n=1 Tax=Thermoanaerobacterium sp. R66 TaxID=2742479 RepID=UPI00237FFBA1|nr:type 4a pilus biogenesis protein PilO [Thermoanaerobacterium sp. R66]MDE4541680.1 type 4a pilus biogenesis protein PilO [Thermoanaerobacterium sp. R66]
MKLTTREKMLIGVLFIVAFFGLYYQLVLTKQLVVIDKLRRDVMSLQTEVNDYNTLSVDKMKNRLSEIDSQIEICNEKLPDYENIEDFVVLLDDAIAKTGVNFEELNFNLTDNQLQSPENQTNNNKISKTKYVEIPVNIKVAGDYSKISNFIEEVQSMQRLNNIKSFEISKDNESNNLLLNIDIVIYSMSKKGGSNLNPLETSGKSDPFKSLVEVNKGNQNTNANSNNQNSLQGIDINKIISDSINSAINNVSKIAPPTPTNKQ